MYSVEFLFFYRMHTHICMCVWSVCVLYTQNKEIGETKSGLVVTFGVMEARPGMNSERKSLTVTHLSHVFL